MARDGERSRDARRADVASPQRRVHEQRRQRHAHERQAAQKRRGDVTAGEARRRPDDEMQQGRRIVPAARDLRDDVHGARRVAHDEHDAAQLIEPEGARPQNGAAEQEQDRDGGDENAGEHGQLAARHRVRSASVGLRRDNR